MIRDLGRYQILKDLAPGGLPDRPWHGSLRQMAAPAGSALSKTGANGIAPKNHPRIISSLERHRITAPLAQRSAARAIRGSRHRLNFKITLFDASQAEWASQPALFVNRLAGW